MSDNANANANANVDKVLSQLYSTNTGEDLSTKLDKAISLVEGINLRNRMKNTTVMQMLFTLEENLNSSIDAAHKDCLDAIQAEAERGGAIVVLGKNGSQPARRRSTLKTIFSKELNATPAFRGTMTTLAVTPEPGFVIKTKKLLGCQDKAFINVFHHPRVELEPVHIPKGQATDKPYIIIGSILSTVDKKGDFCYMYNIAVSSAYFTQEMVTRPDGLRITAPDCVRKIIHKVNCKFDDFLDESEYSLPRLTAGYKGDSVPAITIPIVAPEKVPLTPPPSHAARRSTPPPSSSLSPSSSSLMDGIPEIDEEADRRSVVSDMTDGVTDHADESGPGHAARRKSDGAMLDGVKVAPSKKGVVNKRKSLLDPTQLSYTGGSLLGRNMLHGDMCDFVQSETCDQKAAASLKSAAAVNPTLLLGWQIKVEEIKKGGASSSTLYVVTDVRKNFLHRTEFRLSRFEDDDKWEQLKRNPKKNHGADFRPMRKVLFGLEDVEDDSDMASLQSGSRA